MMDEKVRSHEDRPVATALSSFFFLIARDQITSVDVHDNSNNWLTRIGSLSTLPKKEKVPEGNKNYGVMHTVFTTAAKYLLLRMSDFLPAPQRQKFEDQSRGLKGHIGVPTTFIS
jgi:hypothetical protein